MKNERTEEGRKGNGTQGDGLQPLPCTSCSVSSVFLTLPLFPSVLPFFCIEVSPASTYKCRIKQLVTFYLFIVNVHLEM